MPESKVILLRFSFELYVEIPRLSKPSFLKRLIRLIRQYLPLIEKILKLLYYLFSFWICSTLRTCHVVSPPSP